MMMMMIQIFIKNTSYPEAFRIYRCSVETTRVPEADELRLDGHNMTAKGARDFQLHFKHQLSFFKFKKPLKVLH